MRQRSAAPERIVMLSVVLLMAVGLIFIYSVSGPYSQSQGLSEWYYFIRQTIWTVLAVTTLFVTSLIDYHKLLKLSPFFVAISLGLLVAVLFAPAKQHVHRWLEFGPVQLQPSEVFKVSLIMFLAFSLAKEKARFSNKKKIFMKIIIIMVGMVLVARQPDLGTLTVIFSVTFALLFLVGVKARYLLGGTAAIAIMGSIIVFGIGYEKDRITDYFAILNNPLADINTPGTHGGFYQVRQSLISIGSGGLIGRGLGTGGQKNLFLPAPHTDFVFSSSSEEGGLILGVFILTMFLLFIWGSLKVAQMAGDLEGFLLASGMGMLIAIQAAINIGVATGILPVTGITLPFFSYGGSSLLICCAAVGLILSVARHHDGPRVNYVMVR
ncbi:MAG: cell division protein FtsW [candidate division Zixibacteria bacterium]|nr:cell division protein FtsW [candidate division Zixibacteria bacterium]